MYSYSLMIKRLFESLFSCKGILKASLVYMMRVRNLVPDFILTFSLLNSAPTCIHIQKYIFQSQILHINMDFLLASFNILSIRLWNIFAVSVLNNLRCTHYTHVSYEVCC